jgi:hypothetical protein
MAEIASSVRVQHPRYDSIVPFDSEACCNTAQAGDTLGEFSYYCVTTNTLTTDESISIASLMYKTKKVSASPPITTCEEPDYPLVDFGDVCSDVVTCGNVTKTYNEVRKVAGFVAWTYGRTRVSVIKRLVVCNEGAEPACKFIVECAVEVIYQLGALEKIATTKNATLSGQSDCCILGQGYDPNSGFPPLLVPAGEQCFWNQTQSPPSFDCTTDAEDVAWGATATVWIRKIRVYDNADDIPSTITFGNGDTNTCIYDPCQASEGSLCIAIGGDDIPANQGGNIVTVPITTNCGYCFSFGRECEDCPEAIGNYCPCEPNLPRIDSNSGIAFGMDSFSYVNNPWKVDNSVCHTISIDNIGAFRWFTDCPDCIDHPLGYPGTGVPEEERNDCNWWDCYRCVDGWDPVIDVHQQKQSNVTAYTFYSTSVPYEELYCIPFPTVTITLNP